MMRKAQKTHEPAIRVDDVLLEYHDVCTCGRTYQRSVCWEYDPEGCIWRVTIREPETGRLLTAYEPA